MIERRDILKAALSAVATGLTGSNGQAESAVPAAPSFSRDTVVDLARALAAKPYSAPPNELRDPFSDLTYEQFVGIKTKPGAAIWSGQNKGFSIELLHRGHIFTSAVDLYLVDNGATTRLNYQQDLFDYGGLKLPEKLPDLGFSGFRVMHATKEGVEAELAIFQGASFYRAVAEGQNLGVTSRGLSIRTADPRGEEFPAFRVFWIEKPTLGDNALTIHALLDAPSVAGAYRFTIRPGEATIIDTELTLFARTYVDHYGLAGFAAVSLFSPLDRRRQDDLRPMVASANGLQMLTGATEWLWRPLSNRENLQYSSFVDTNPKGYGALLRDRNIFNYEDDDQHWERRPSLWIEPLGDWGPGALQLVEIPSESENNENIVAYWRPTTPLVVGLPATYAYRQFWCWDPPTRPPLATTVEARAGRAPTGKRRRFLVVFSGDILSDPNRTTQLTAALTTSPGAASNIRTFLNPALKTCRVTFDIDPSSENFCEMRLVLKSGDTPISETWLYRWTP